MQQTKSTFRLVLIAIFMFSFGIYSARLALAATTVMYITPTGLTSGACDSWANACDLQYGLTSAVANSELWVKAGTYLPTTTTDRALTFELTNGVALYGGFAGTEILREQRDWATNLTVLSGDLLGNDAPNFSNYEDNSFHVLVTSGADDTTILDGLTIKDGSADSDGTVWAGGGMYNLNSSPTVTNVTFSENYSVNIGGAGMYNSNSSPTLLNVTFTHNEATIGKGGGLLNANASHPTLTNVTFSANNRSSYGGGMANIENSNPTLNNVTFDANRSLYGGGMYNLNSSPTLTNVTFSGNTSYVNSGDGAGMYNDASSPTLTDVTFLNNAAGPSWGYGGGMYNINSSAPSLTRVLFSGNTALSISSWGGGMINDASNPILVDVVFSGNSAAIGGGMRNFHSSPVLTNVIFDSNTTSAFGGGMDSLGGSPVLTNVTFTGNTAAYGGALHNYGNSSPILTNVTISGNSATVNGGALSNGGNPPTAPSSPVLKNVIVWGNSAPSGAEIYNNTDGTPLIENSIVAGGCPAGSTCTNVLNADPLLGTLADNGGFSKTLALGIGSPAIDAGNSATCASTDQRGVARPQGSACDMGAYELVQVGYVTSTPTPTEPLTLTQTPTPTKAVTVTRTRTPTVIKTLTKTRTPTHTVIVQTFKSIAAQDGWILESGENSNVGGAIGSGATTFNLGDSAAKTQYLGILSFDTGASLPDTAVITTITLKVRKNAVVGGGDPLTIFQGFMADIKNGYFGTAALHISDFQATASNSYGPFTPALIGNWYSIDLTSAKGYINKSATGSGLTQLRLRFKLDDNNNAVANYLSLYSGNASDADRPQLVITYVMP